MEKKSYDTKEQLIKAVLQLEEDRDKDRETLTALKAENAALKSELEALKPENKKSEWW